MAHPHADGWEGLFPATLLVLAMCGCQDYSVSSQSDEAREPVEVVETFVQAPSPMVDVLWVVDNTPSMAEEQEALAASFQAFVAQMNVSRIAFQLGVVPADVVRDDSGELRGNPWIVTPTSPDPTQDFLAALAVGTEGVGPEAGLGAAYLALTDPLRSGANRGFRRLGAALHIIVVSDADDESDILLGDDPASLFLDFMADEAELNGGEVLFSALAGDVPGGCHGSGGTARPGTRYAEVVEASGGTFGSICAADLSEVVDALGLASHVYTGTFALQAAPEEESVAVYLNGVRQGNGWSLSLEPPAIIFTVPPEPDTLIMVTYQIFESEA